ncbi:MAG: ComEC/Rec2 family competence protein [Chthoniobacteraceae bacterium]
MSQRLSVTFLDVGWGDSILIEAEDARGNCFYALVDSNDTLNQPSSLLFLKRFFERKGIPYRRPNPRVFRFVLLTHTHADHASGLPRLLREFGSDYLLYSSSSSPGDPFLAQILRYCRHRGARLGATEAVYHGKPLRHIPFGPVSLSVLWPRHGFSDPNENNNSVVLALTLKKITFLLTGDVNAGIAPQIVRQIPANTKVVQVPHHGAENGTFDAHGATPWINHFMHGSIPSHFALSCHPRPHNHPHRAVINALTSHLPSAAIRRTDKDYHLKFETDGTTVTSYYTHA